MVAHCLAPQKLISGGSLPGTAKARDGCTLQKFVIAPQKLISGGSLPGTAKARDGCTLPSTSKAY